MVVAGKSNSVNAGPRCHKFVKECAEEVLERAFVTFVDGDL